MITFLPISTYCEIFLVNHYRYQTIDTIIEIKSTNKNNDNDPKRKKIISTNNTENSY